MKLNSKGAKKTQTGDSIVRTIKMENKQNGESKETKVYRKMADTECR